MYAIFGITFLLAMILVWWAVVRKCIVSLSARLTHNQMRRVILAWAALQAGLFGYGVLSDYSGDVGSVTFYEYVTGEHYEPCSVFPQKPYIPPPPPAGSEGAVGWDLGQICCSYGALQRIHLFTNLPFHLVTAVAVKPLAEPRSGYLFLNFFLIPGGWALVGFWLDSRHRERAAASARS